MASKEAARLLLRRGTRLPSRAAVSSRRTVSALDATCRGSTLTLTTTSKHGIRPIDSRLPLGQTRAFSRSARRRNAEAAALDPNQIERESDEVDVCIVGGGESFQCPLAMLVFVPGKVALCDQSG